MSADLSPVTVPFLLTIYQQEALTKKIDKRYSTNYYI
jgi:hypothetical protein